MKNYKEMAEDVLSRIKEEQEANEKKQHAMKKTISYVVVLCVAAVLSVSLWRLGFIKPITPSGENSEHTEMESQQEEASDREYTLADKMAVAVWAKGKTERVGDIVDSGSLHPSYTKRNGIACSRKLDNLLNDTEDENTIFAIHITDIRYDDLAHDWEWFEYDGETYREFIERVSQPGEKTEAEINAMHERNDKFYEAYKEYVAQRIADELLAQGITAVAEKGACYIFVTKEELDAIKFPEPVSNYYLTLAGQEDDAIGQIKSNN